MEHMYMEVRKRLGELQSYLTRGYRSYDRIRPAVQTMKRLYHEYRKVKRREVNLWL